MASPKPALKKAATVNGYTSVRNALMAAANPERALIMQGFFKTGRGEYAEGDIFIWVSAPEQRRIAKSHAAIITEKDIRKLISSPVHEERLTGLFLLIHQYRMAAKTKGEKVWADLYWQLRKHINNWDLVDTSAPHILGHWLFDKPRDILFEYAKTGTLWEQRICMLTTQYFIRQGDCADTFSLAKMLLHHPHDLIHKAVGWMLREAGQKEKKNLEIFLHTHASVMPRTMLRYAIEKLPEKERKKWMAMKTKPKSAL